MKAYQLLVAAILATAIGTHLSAAVGPNARQIHLKGVSMRTTLKYLAAMAVSLLLATGVSAQSAEDRRGPSPLVPIENEAPARLIVDPPLPEALSQGLVFIQYATENLRVLPVFGSSALSVSPRIGHLHITVDDAPWHFVDTSGETIVLVPLIPGPHRVLIELADPTHRVITSETIEVIVPDLTVNASQAP